MQQTSTLNKPVSDATFSINHRFLKNSGREKKKKTPKKKINCLKIEQNLNSLFVS